VGAGDSNRDRAVAGDTAGPGADGDVAVGRGSTCPLAGDPTSAGLARRFVERQLAEWGRAELVDVALLLASELVTNALLHAGGVVKITLEDLGDRVRVAVHDPSPVVPHERKYGTEAVTGRGLSLIRQEALASGVTRTGRGKAVWFDLGAGEPTGRFDAGRVAGAGCVEVVLERLPATLYLAAQEQTDAMFREYALLAWTDPESGLPGRVAEADRIHGAVVGAVCDALEKTSDEPVADLVVMVPGDVAAAVDEVLVVLDEAEEEAAAGHFLSRPSLPEIRLLRDWYLREVEAQALRPPVAWCGVDAVRDAATMPPVVPFAWTNLPDVDTQRAVVVADDANRIVDVTDAAAELLGRTRADLAGDRLVAIVPSRFRDAHIAGFTRYLATGHARLIGRAATVPVLRGDGSETDVRLLVQRHSMEGGRTLFIAVLEPTTSNPDNAGRSLTGLM
jgi:PAS domain S-box-containing protein